MTEAAIKPFEQKTFVEQLEEYAPQFAAVLPGNIPVEKFKRVVITALNQSPDLRLADRRTLFTSCVKAAQDGLLPDGREAALVVYNTKRGKGETAVWIKAVQYLPMITGIRKRMRNSGEVASAEAHVVYERDEFDYALGDEPKIVHRPAITNRGRPIGAYAIIKLANGEVLREFMDHASIEHIRSVSRAKEDGPWNAWWEEMARKTVLRRCAKSAPMSSEMDQVLKRDDELEESASVALPPRPKYPDRRPIAATHNMINDAIGPGFAEAPEPPEPEKMAEPATVPIASDAT